MSKTLRESLLCHTRIGCLLAFGLYACGKSSLSSSPGAIMDFTEFGTLQFKSSASSFGVSGTRYDLDLNGSSVKKYTYSSDSNQYELDSEKSLATSTKSSLTSKLERITYRRFSSCGDCNQTRPTVWIEITDRSTPLYYFSNKGDCSCPADGNFAPTLPYEKISAVYDEIIALF